MTHKNLAIMNEILDWLEASILDDVYDALIQRLIDTGVRYPEKALRQLHEEVSERLLQA